MWGPKKLAVACSTALVTSVLVVAAPMLTTPATAAEILISGGFEGGPPWSAWTQADSAFVTPICDINICSTGGGGVAAPRTGECWAKFGGVANAGHASSISQTLTIPEGIPTLTYWYRNGTVTAPFDATLTVKLDDDTLTIHTEASTPQADYTQQTFDLSPYADGDQHTLSFAYLNGGTGTNNMTVDDISIDLDGFPEADAGDDQVVNAGDTVTLDGSGSSDPDGPLADLSWEQTSGPEVTLASEETLQPTFTAPAGGSVLTFELIVADGSGNFDADEVTIAVNGPPVADAGPDQVISAGSGTVTLDGTGSSDPDSNPLDYSWVQTSGSAVTVTGGTTAQPTFTAPAAASTLTFELTVDDGNGADDTDSVTITVADTTAPDTTFATQPPGGVAKSLTVPFTFASSEPGTFSCALDTTVFTSCTSPTTVTVAPGPHVFRVAATDAAAQTDPTPATSSFVAYDCTTLDAQAAKAAKKVTKLKKQIRTTTDPDKRAKLKKKLKRAKQALKAADAAAQPCHT